MQGGEVVARFDYAGDAGERRGFAADEFDDQPPLCIAGDEGQAGGAPTYSDGYATQLSVSAHGSILARNNAGSLYRRVGSNAGLGSSWEQIIPTPAALTSPVRLGSGAFQFSFTNQSDAPFTAHATTNIALPFAQWSNLGPVAETPPGSGRYQFTDPQATNRALRFYRVTSP